MASYRDYLLERIEQECERLSDEARVKELELLIRQLNAECYDERESED
jgi:hypothetical protein